VNTVSDLANSPTRSGLLPSQPVKWGLPDAAIGLVLTEAAIVGMRLLGQIPGFPHTDAVGVALQTGFYILVAVYVLLVARHRGLGRLKLDFGLELVWIDLLLGAALAIVVQFVYGLVASIAVGTLGLPPVPDTNASLPHSQVWAGIDGLAVASFFVPIVEELFFRGLVLRAVRNFVIRTAKRGGDATIRRAQWISIVASAVIFAAAHLYEAVNATELVELGISVLIFGLGAAWIASRTGRLGPSIIAHMITNGIVTLTELTAHER
jgi:uncharacterized protein